MALLLSLPQSSPIVHLDKDTDASNASLLITFLRRSYTSDGGVGDSNDKAARQKRPSVVSANPVPTPNLPVGRMLVRIPQGAPPLSCLVVSRCLGEPGAFVCVCVAAGLDVHGGLHVLENLPVLNLLQEGAGAVPSAPIYFKLSLQLVCGDEPAAVVSGTRVLMASAEQAADVIYESSYTARKTARSAQDSARTQGTHVSQAQPSVRSGCGCRPEFGPRGPLILPVAGSQ